MKFFASKAGKITSLFLLGGLLLFLSIPLPQFSDKNYATILEAENGALLGARIAADGQWRFPASDSIPKKFKEAIILFEDEYFYKHPGINPVSMWKAFVENVREGKIKRGGSTLSMQVVRLSRQNKARTIPEKILEVLVALKMELFLSKDEILNLYASHAPFGGNVVGLSAASWRYYGRPPENLSWGETATLAVLPNSPALIYPGKNSRQLLRKRNRLLDKLLQRAIIDEGTTRLAKAESLPGLPLPLPNLASHLVDRAKAEGHTGKRVTTTLNYKLQSAVAIIVQQHHERLKGNYIRNAAALVIEIETGNSLAYVGNVSSEGTYGQHVDMVTANRSTGSILKPILYAASIGEGVILPRQLLPDVPVFLQGFAPQNFDKQFHGTVPADKALARSYNVPFVHLLKEYGYEKFHQKLKNIGVHALDKPSGHYGLAMILGGAESSLWEISAVYAGMARSLLRYFKRPLDRKYSPQDYHSNQYIKKISSKKERLQSQGMMEVGGISQMFNAMQELERPESESGWEQYTSSTAISWKTGTSYGFKDAWAIGLNANHLVAVWVGNADGEGRPELVGVKAAAPLMFDIFKELPGDEKFSIPTQSSVRTCAISGFKAGVHCDSIQVLNLPDNSKKSPLCPHHHTLHLDETETFQVNSQCYPVHKMKKKKWFVLPPAEAWYYGQFNAAYKEPPEFLANCGEQNASDKFMELIYPRDYTRVYIPRELDGSMGAAVFEVAHRNPAATIHWHLDEQYLGKTSQKHQMGVRPEKGRHRLYLVDDQGRELSLNFEALSQGN